MVRLICGYVWYKINGELSPRRNRRDPRILQYSRFIVGNQEVQLEGKRNRGADERKKFEVGNLLTGARNGVAGGIDWWHSVNVELTVAVGDCSPSCLTVPSS